MFSTWLLQSKLVKTSKAHLAFSLYIVFYFQQNKRRKVSHICSLGLVTNYHELRGLKQEKRIFCGSEGQKSEIMVSAGLQSLSRFQGRTLRTFSHLWEKWLWVHLGLWPHRSNLCLHLHMASPLCVSSLGVSCKDAGHCIQGPLG